MVCLYGVSFVRDSRPLINSGLFATQKLVDTWPLFCQPNNNRPTSFHFSFVLEYLSQILTLCINMKLNIIGTR